MTSLPHCVLPKSPVRPPWTFHVRSADGRDRPGTERAQPQPGSIKTLRRVARFRRDPLHDGQTSGISRRSAQALVCHSWTPPVRGRAQAWRIASPSISILIFLLTITPPVSSAEFQVRPNVLAVDLGGRAEAEDVLAVRAVADALELDRRARPDG